MERLAYLFDTNAIADYINGFEPTTTRIRQAIRDGHTVFLCQPVRYEVLRGLIKTQAERKRRIFEQLFASQLLDLTVTEEDWRQAAQFWVDTASRGKQLSDIDLLIAALAIRLDAVIVSDDDDYDALPVKRENWRKKKEQEG